MEIGMTNRVHRVGSVTFGFVLVLFGILFLLRIWVPWLDYTKILHFWPCSLIMLGIEVLVASFQKEKRFIYDKAAICFMFLVLIFAFGVGFGEWILEHAATYVAV